VVTLNKKRGNQSTLEQETNNVVFETMNSRRRSPIAAELN